MRVIKLFYGYIMIILIQLLLILTPYIITDINQFIFILSINEFNYIFFFYPKLYKIITLRIVSAFTLRYNIKELEIELNGL